MELLERLESLKPAGAGRADTQARELRKETELLHRTLAEAELRSSHLHQRAVNRAGASLWEELRRFAPQPPPVQEDSLSAYPLAWQQEPQQEPQPLREQSPLYVSPQLVLHSSSPPRTPTEVSEVAPLSEPAPVECAQEDDLEDSYLEQSVGDESADSIALETMVQTVSVPGPMLSLMRDTAAREPALPQSVKRAVAAQSPLEPAELAPTVSERAPLLLVDSNQATRVPLTKNIRQVDSKLAKKPLVPALPLRGGAVRVPKVAGPKAVAIRARSAERSPPSRQARGAERSQAAQIAPSKAQDAKSSPDAKVAPSRWGVRSAQPKRRTTSNRAAPLPTDSQVRKAFIACDRSSNCYLTKEMFFEGVERPEMKSVLRAGFGGPLVDQPRPEMIEDLEYIWACLSENLEKAGLISVPEFTIGMLKLMKELKFLVPPSPRINRKTKHRWIALVHAWRRNVAECALKVPLLALQRLVRRMDAVQEANRKQARGGWRRGRKLLPDRFVEQARLVQRCDWPQLCSADLSTACLALSRLTQALRGVRRRHQSQTHGSESESPPPSPPRSPSSRASSRSRKPSAKELLAEAMDGILLAARRLHEVLFARLPELLPGEIAAICIARLPAPVAAGCEVEAALEHRALTRALAHQAGDLELAELAQLARIFDDLVIHDTEFLTASARDVCARCSSGSDALALAGPGDLAALVWILARYRLTPDGAQHPLEVLNADRAICAKLPGLVGKVKSADLARLIWGLGHLGDKPLGLIDELGKQASLRAKRDVFSARELARITWGLAVLGARPPDVDAIASKAARAAGWADVEAGPGRLEAPELAQLAAALGAWAVGDEAELQPLWTVLRRRIADFTGEELLMALTATVTLGIRDDDLVANAQARALIIGPFDSEGAGDFLRCLQGYADRFHCEHVRGLSAAYAVQAVRSGGLSLNIAEFSQSFAPSAIARLDPFCSV